MTPPPRRADARSGARGEALAAEFLQSRGYRIEARNIRTTHGEIDLLAHDGAEWSAVEVKARADHPAPEATVRPEQLDRIGRSLHAVARGLRPRPRTLRIDILAIRWTTDGPEIRHFPSVRRWRKDASTCGWASVPDRPTADTWARDHFVASAFRLWRICMFRLRRGLNLLRSRRRHSDADPR